LPGILALVLFVSLPLVGCGEDRTAGEDGGGDEQSKPALSEENASVPSADKADTEPPSAVEVVPM
jgi:hypothetical protein